MLYTMGKRKPFASFTPTASQERLVVLYVFGINFDKTHPKIQKNRKKCTFSEKNLYNSFFCITFAPKLKHRPTFL